MPCSYTTIYAHSTHYTHKQGLEDSLARFVQGERISDFEWNEGQTRVNITKRQCVASLSNTIFLHLKRFELNYHSFQREKVNDYFPFPTLLGTCTPLILYILYCILYYTILNYSVLFLLYHTR